jgi:hypothetical protein
VLKCIAGWGRRISPGPSLLTRDHLKQLVPDASSPCLAPLTTLVNLLLAGTMDDATVDWLSASSLSAIGKPGKDGELKRDSNGRLQCRPIAAPESIYALSAKVLLVEALPDVKDTLAAAKQLGVKVSSACEAIVASIEVFMQDGDDDALEERVCVAIQSDATSAFNTISRAAVVAAVHKYCPRMLPFVRLFYAKDSRLVWGRRGPGATPCFTIMSSDGVRQGCPIAMLLFGLAYMEALNATQEQHPTVFIPSMADDTTVLGAPEEAAAAFVTLRAEMHKLGMGQNESKCYAYSAQQHASTLPLPAGTTPSDNGIISLGAPMGTKPYMDGYVADKLKRPMAIMRALPLIGDPSIAFTILRVSLLPRVRYLLSVIPAGFGEDTFDAWDALVKTTIAKLLDKPTAPDTAFMPFKQGGLGLWLIADRRAEIFLRGKDRGLRAARQHFPELAQRLDAARGGSSVSATGRALQRAREQLPADLLDSLPSLAELSSLDDNEARSAGKKMKEAVVTHAAKRVKQELPFKQKMIVELSARPGTAAFLTLTPTFKRDRLSPAEFRAAVCIRLGLPHDQLNSICVGDARLARTVIRQKGKASIAHDELEKVYAEISKEAGRKVDTEVRGLFGPYPNQASHAVKKGENRRMDMLEQDSTTGMNNMTDNFITDGAGAGASLANPLKLLLNAEKKKIKKYVDGTGPPGFGFTPLGSGTQCELSEKTFKWLTDAATAVAKRASSDGVADNKVVKRIRWRYMQRLGVTLMRAQAGMIFKYALEATRRKYITTLSGQRRATHSRGAGRAAGRSGGGGRANGPWAGRGRQPQR